ncbi:MAG: hypothetical protein KF851_09165 [Pirellulaceae bacterium]|nr:hypothetical protein [Pirellulaceae bacterium]
MSVNFDLGLPPYGDFPVPGAQPVADAVVAPTPSSRVAPIRFPHIPSRERAEAKPSQYFTATGTVLRRDAAHEMIAEQFSSQATNQVAVAVTAGNRDSAVSHCSESRETTGQALGEPKIRASNLAHFQVAQIAALLQQKTVDQPVSESNQQTATAVSLLRERLIEHGTSLGNSPTLDTTVWDTFVKLCHAYAIIADSENDQQKS